MHSGKKEQVKSRIKQVVEVGGFSWRCQRVLNFINIK